MRAFQRDFTYTAEDRRQETSRDLRGSRAMIMLALSWDRDLVQKVRWIRMIGEIDEELNSRSVMASDVAGLIWKLRDENSSS